MSTSMTVFNDIFCMIAPMGAIQGSVLRALYGAGPVWTGFFEKPLWLLGDPYRAKLDYRYINLI